MFDIEISNRRYDLSNGLSVLTPFEVVMNYLAIFSHFVRNSVCYVFIFSNCYLPFSLLILDSLLISSMNRSSSSSLSFYMLIDVVIPN